MNELNFVIAYPYGNGELACYMIHSREVLYGTDKEAKETLDYVKRKSPGKKWGIYAVCQHPLPIATTVAGGRRGRVRSTTTRTTTTSGRRARTTRKDK